PDRFDRSGKPANGMQDWSVRAKQFVKPRYNYDSYARCDCGNRSAAECVASLHDHIFHSEFLRQRSRGIDILLFIIAQVRTYRDVWKLVHRFDHISPGPGSYVQNANRPPFLTKLFDYVSQRLLKIRFAMPNATPTNAVEIRFVDQTTDA